MFNKLITLRKGADERGSYSLEMVLAIGAVALVSAGIVAFYGNISDFFNTFDVNGVACQGVGC